MNMVRHDNIAIQIHMVVYFWDVFDGFINNLPCGDRYIRWRLIPAPTRDGGFSSCSFTISPKIWALPFVQMVTK
ncbi:MAG: hypothetical protein FWB98_00505 [Defluviitaleaceae bacterium]|nr:hypothetical protein [Defluviitaleaceae bacterium]